MAVTGEKCLLLSMVIPNHPQMGVDFSDLVDRVTTPVLLFW